MNDFIIFTDSSSDLDEKMLKELGVKYCPLTFEMDGKTYANWADWHEIAPDVFYDRLKNGATCKTSQVNAETFKDAWRPLVKKGKDILYLGFSSGLSGTVNAGAMAAKELMEEIPGSNIVAVDTLSASLGQGLLVWHVCQLKKKGKTLAEIVKWLELNKLHMVHWFTVDDLGTLKRGGRISSATALVGGMLNIKPVLHVDDEGHLVPVTKVRGRKKSLDKLVEEMQKTAINPEKQMVFISHGDSLKDAEYLRNQIKLKMGVKHFYINYVGPVIGSHSGPGTIALFFLGTER